MKFKVGDKVKFTYGGLVGQGEIRIVDNSFLPYLVVSENGTCWWLKENELELINPDLRDLLQVGYMYITTDDKFLVDHIDVLYFVKRSRDKNLKGLGFWKDIIAIYKPKYNGVKPMEWVLVWEREKEKLYTLELPNTTVGNRFLLLNIKNNNYEFNHISIDPNHIIKKTRNNSYRIRFTQQEIDNLPNQELIKVLVKKEIKGN